MDDSNLVSAEQKPHGVEQIEVGLQDVTHWRY